MIGKLPEVRALAGNVQTPAWKEEGPVGLRRSEDGAAGSERLGVKPGKPTKTWEVRLRFLKRFGIKIVVFGRTRDEGK